MSRATQTSILKGVNLRRGVRREVGARRILYNPDAWVWRIANRRRYFRRTGTGRRRDD